VALVFGGVGTRAQSAGAATIAPAKPAVDSIGGVLLAVVWSKNNAVHSCSTADWANLDQKNSGASFTASLWIAAEGAAAPTFTWTGSVACGAQLSYYEDPQNPLDTSIAAIGGTTGSANPHTSSSITSTRDGSLAVYVDAAAANTAIATPAGWTENLDNGSATDATRNAFGSKLFGASGSTSGAISITGAAAAWVQWQLEIRRTAAPGFQVSKEEMGAWLDAPRALSFSKVEVGAWLDAGALQFSKIEVGAWLDASGSVDNPGFCSIIW
jgi:hypothetical protein